MRGDSSLPSVQRLADELRRGAGGDSLLLLREVQIADPALADSVGVASERLRNGEGRAEDGVGEGERSAAEEGEGVELGEEEARVGVGGEAGLDGFQVEEIWGV